MRSTVGRCLSWNRYTYKFKNVINIQNMLLLHNYNIKNKVDKNITKVIKTKCMPTNIKTFICIIQSYYCVPFKTHKVVFLLYMYRTLLHKHAQFKLCSTKRKNIPRNDDIPLSSLFYAFIFRARETRQ